MALYDSSQLANIIAQSNVHFTQMYGGLYAAGATPVFNSFGSGAYTGNPFGGFNDVSRLKLVPTTMGSKIDLSGILNPSTKKYSFNSSVGNLSLTSGNASTWSRYGYDASAGARLASVARNNSVGFTGYCARYVKDAICDAGLGKYEYGHAYQMDDILRRNPNFREIPASTDVKSLPAGCVLVFNQGSKGYSSEYGHTEITDGRGRGISDGITRNLRQPDAIFMPVAA
jgi:hypothetical protein